MKRTLVALLLFAPAIAMAQTPPPTNVTMSNNQPRPVTPVACLDSNASWISCGGSSSGGDASATNQQSQLTQEQLIAARLGDTATPANGTVNARLALILAATGTVQGNVASAAADSGAPVKVGCKYNAALPTFTDGSRGDCQVDLRGNLRVFVTGAQLAGTDAISNNNLMNFTSYVTQAGGVAPLTTANFFYEPVGGVWLRARGDTNGGYVVNKGGSSLATAQVSVGTTSTLIAAARTGRQKITVTLGAANDCFFGATGVTSTTGFRVKGVDGASLTLDTAAALYGVCTATTTVGEVELF